MLVLETKEINKDTYVQLMKLMSHDIKTAHEMVEEIAIRCGYHPAGYGCYNPKWFSDSTGHYYVTWYHGDSCD